LPCFYKEKISQSCPLFWYAACGQHLAQVPFGARYHAVNRVGACFHSGRGKGFQGVAVPSRLHNLLAKSIAGFSIQAYETLETNKVAGTATPNACTTGGQPNQLPLKQSWTHHRHSGEDQPTFYRWPHSLLSYTDALNIAVRCRGRRPVG